MVDETAHDENIIARANAVRLNGLLGRKIPNADKFCLVNSTVQPDWAYCKVVAIRVRVPSKAVQRNYVGTLIVRIESRDRVTMINDALIRDDTDHVTNFPVSGDHRDTN